MNPTYIFWCKGNKKYPICQTCCDNIELYEGDKHFTRDVCYAHTNKHPEIKPYSCPFRTGPFTGTQIQKEELEMREEIIRRALRIEEKKNDPQKDKRSKAYIPGIVTPKINEYGKRKF